jgi:hypothetical protein
MFATHDKGRYHAYSGEFAYMMITRRLFVVPLADNNHGKTTAINALLMQGLGAASPEETGVRTLISPWGRQIDAYVFVRSYQETEKKKHKSVAAALSASDRQWKERDLIFFPSHVRNAKGDIAEMIAAAHGAGFDAVCATFIFTGARSENRSIHSDIWSQPWDERWTVPNPRDHDKPADGQLRALGCDLWTKICAALTA